MAKKHQEPKQAPVNEPAVTVKVIANALGEGGVTYLRGATFETTAERAAALAGLVEIVKEAK
jgi:transposase